MCHGTRECQCGVDEEEMVVEFGQGGCYYVLSGRCIIIEVGWLRFSRLLVAY